MWAFCWAPILAIGVLHYATEPSQVWLHDILRHLYYLPIIIASFHAGLRGGLTASVVVSLSYLPHAFMLFGHLGHIDPAGPWDKAMTLLHYNAVGAIAGYLASAERKRRRQLQASLDEQRQLQKQLVRAEQLSALGELIAGVTHEIKTPLHALRGTAEIVDPLIPKDSKERRMWELHCAEIERLGTIAERFQAFARPQAGKIEHIDLNDVASRLRDLLSGEARKQDIRIDFAPSSSPALVHADGDQLIQVGLNIGVNAIRAMRTRGSRVGIRVLSAAITEPPTMHALLVDNDGPAILENQLLTLFDPFVSNGGGAGLGLTIAERIVQLHGGFIEATNSGLGVTFSVYLPEMSPFESD